MSLLLDLFGFLSVILRGLSLVAQSFTFGGLAFLFLILKPSESRLSADSLEISHDCLNFLRISAFSFAFFTFSSLVLNAAVLAGTLGISWFKAASADFAQADLVIFSCALFIGLLAGGSWNALRWMTLAGLALLALAMQLSLTHAASRLGLQWPHLLSDAIHMLAVALWIGAYLIF